MRKVLVVVAFVALMMSTFATTAFANGTETLGPPSIPLATGSGIVAAGTGMFSQPGTINITVPGTVKQAFLYWQGEHHPNGFDQTVLVNGVSTFGQLIGGPTFFYGAGANLTNTRAYRADITSKLASGPNSFLITDMNFNVTNNGAAIVVVYDDGSAAELFWVDGVDISFINFPERRSTIPQTFNFTSASVARTGTLNILAGSVFDDQSRPNQILVTMNGITTNYDNLLGSLDGPEWDTLTLPVSIPAGVSAMTVQVMSWNDGSEDLPASLVWVGGGLTVPAPPAPTLTSEVHDAQHNDITGASAPLGTVVHDKAILSGASVPPATGTFTYKFFTTGDCSGTSADETVAVGSESSTRSVGAGSYSYKAQYSGDANYPPVVGPCEPFSISPTPPAVATHVHNAAHQDITGTSVLPGTVVHDNADVSGVVVGYPLAGTITYKFFTTGDCSGTSTDETVAVGSESSTRTPGPGAYSYLADFTSTNANYANASGICEPFTVAPVTPSVVTEVHNPAHQDITGTSVPLGTVVHDKATVSGRVAGNPLTGTVTYKFFTTGNCTGTSTDETVALGAESSTRNPGAGAYSYLANFTSTNVAYANAAGVCEPFTVSPKTPSVVTEVHNASHQDITGTSVPLGTVVHDKATVDGAVAGYPLTGTVTYKFFTTGNCTGTSTDETVALGAESSTRTPGAGSYSYLANFTSTSANYANAAGVCEPFTVSPKTPSVVTEVHNASHQDITGTSVPTGTVVHDKATVNGAVAGYPLTGTVTYKFFTTGNCTGTSTDETVALGAESSTRTPGAGSYSYLANFTSTSANYANAAGICEPFSVSQKTVRVKTQVHDKYHNDITGKSVPVGTVVHDSATIYDAVAGYPATGTITYKFFTTGNCTGASTDQTVAVGSESSTRTPTAGSYSYLASYSGNATYAPATGVCEPFTVVKPTVKVKTEVHNKDHYDITYKTVALGTTVHDYAEVYGEISGSPITGTITYKFFTTGNCTGTSTDQTVPVGDASSSRTPGAGAYSYRANYSGNTVYAAATGECEPFSIAKGYLKVKTEVHDKYHNDITGDTVKSGTVVHDSAKVYGAVSGFPLTGTISYRFYTNNSCYGSYTEQTVALGAESSTRTPSVGSYAYKAVFNSTSPNYASTSGICEPFSVSKYGGGSCWGNWWDDYSWKYGYDGHDNDGWW